MVSKQKIIVEVAYATPMLQQIISIEVDEACTIQEAIERSGILNIFPEIDLEKQKVGIFSKQKNLSDTLQQNDRIEIYRPLIIDPKEARRNRVDRRKFKKGRR